jgi:hypothetical protein
MMSNLFKHEDRKVIIFAVDAKIAEHCAIDNALDGFVFYKDVSVFQEHCATTEITPLTHTIWVHKSANLRSDLMRLRKIASDYEFNVEFKERQYYANLLDPVEYVQ